MKKYILLLMVSMLWGSVFASQDTARVSADWVKNGVIYEVFTRDFGPQGNFKEIEARIPEIKKLGATIIWLMPIHPIGEKERKGTWGSPYAIRDYLKITPDYGTEDDFRSLVKSAHKNGLRVIIDMVANHTAWDYSWITTNPDYYHHDSTGKIIPPNPHWNDVAWLDYSNPALRAEMTKVLKYWVEKCDIDGYRCDVAGGVPTDFWESVRTELVKIKPEIIMLAESYKPEHHVKAFDLSYSWPLYDAVQRTLEGKTAAYSIASTFLQEREKFPVGSMLLRFIDNHDKTRAPLVFGEEKWKPAAALSFLVPGVPLVYNSQEIGDTTMSRDPFLFEKNPIQWSGETTERGKEYWQYYKTLLDLRKNSSALRSNQIKFLTNTQPGEVVTFLRWDHKEKCLVAINFSQSTLTLRIYLTNTGVGYNLTLEDMRDSKQSFKSGGVVPEMDIPANDYKIWRIQ